MVTAMTPLHGCEGIHCPPSTRSWNLAGTARPVGLAFGFAGAVFVLERVLGWQSMLMPAFWTIAVVGSMVWAMVHHHRTGVAAERARRPVTPEWVPAHVLEAPRVRSTLERPPLRVLDAQVIPAEITSLPHVVTTNRKD